MVPISSYYSPVDIPPNGPGDSPLVCAHINVNWLKYVAGALSQLRLPVAWRYTTNTELDQVMYWVDELIGTIGTAPECTEMGSLSLTILVGNSDVTSAVTFPSPFSAPPVVVQSSDSEVLIASSQTVTTTGFNATLTSATPVLVNTTALYSWIAGPAS